MQNMDTRVAGESAVMVLAALRDTTVTPAPDGMTRFEFDLDPESAEGTAFMRALARMVGRLTTRDLLEELKSGVRPRTERQRRADALVELVREATEALDAAQGHPRTPSA